MSNNDNKNGKERKAKRPVPAAPKRNTRSRTTPAVDVDADQATPPDTFDIETALKAAADMDMSRLPPSGQVPFLPSSLEEMLAHASPIPSTVTPPPVVNRQAGLRMPLIPDRPSRPPPPRPPPVAEGPPVPSTPSVRVIQSNRFHGVRGQPIEFSPGYASPDAQISSTPLTINRIVIEGKLDAVLDNAADGVPTLVVEQRHKMSAPLWVDCFQHELYATRLHCTECLPVMHMFGAEEDAVNLPRSALPAQALRRDHYRTLLVSTEVPVGVTRDSHARNLPLHTASVSLRLESVRTLCVIELVNNASLVVKSAAASQLGHLAAGIQASDAVFALVRQQSSLQIDSGFYRSLRMCCLSASLITGIDTVCSDMIAVCDTRSFIRNFTVVDRLDTMLTGAGNVVLADPNSPPDLVQPHRYERTSGMWFRNPPTLARGPIPGRDISVPIDGDELAFGTDVFSDLLQRENGLPPGVLQFSHHAGIPLFAASLRLPFRSTASNPISAKKTGSTLAKKPARIEDQPTCDEEDRQCRICQVYKAVHVLECGHWLACAWCVHDLMEKKDVKAQCFVCRSPIEKVILVYDGEYEKKTQTQTPAPAALASSKKQ